MRADAVEVSPCVTYVIEGMPIGPSLNDRGDRLSGWRAREAKRKAQDAMRDVVNSTPRPSLYPLENVLLEFVFFMPTWRDRDLRNIGVQCKPYEDVLVELCVIAGDGWRNSPTQLQRVYYRKKWSGFEIRVYSLDEVEVVIKEL